MKKIFAYISISLMALTYMPNSLLFAQTKAKDIQTDSITIPLNMNFGIDIAGPIIRLINDEASVFEGIAYFDINEKYRLSTRIGYSKYSHHDTFYDFNSNGIYAKAGIDFNFLRPDLNDGKYWAGIGLAYGVSLYSYNTPRIETKNYWGTAQSSFSMKNRMGHFIEICPGFDAELFKHLRIGWRVSLRKIIYSGTDKNSKPIYMPGYGQGTKSITFGINYFLTWNLSYKKIRVKIKQETREENDDTEVTPSNDENNAFGSFDSMF